MALIKLLLLAYIISIILVIVLSYFPQQSESPANQVFLFLRRITDPVLDPVRRVIPPVGGVLDLSPTIVLFVLFAIYGAI